MHWVFAYGSNMDLDDLKGWLSTSNLPPGRIVQAQAAKLVGYRLVWNYFSKGRAGGAANIEPDSCDLPGVALRVDEALLRAIDVKEGFPNRYDRVLTRAVLGSGRSIRAWAYVVLSEHRANHAVPPTRHYKSLLVRGAIRFNLPMSHISELEKLSTCD